MGTDQPADGTDGPAVGSRSTRQKRAVVAELESGTHFRSAQDIWARLRETGDAVGLTTVYTQLRALAAAGEVDAVRTDASESLYRRCGTTEHHHHIVCRECGCSVAVAGPAVERWASMIAAQTGFTDVRHLVEISGRCADCTTATSSRPASRTSAS